MKIAVIGTGHLAGVAQDHFSKLGANVFTIDGKRLQRISKSNLAQNEGSGPERMKDLFRLFMLSETTTQTGQYSEEFKQSLKSTREESEDFDFVIDARAPQEFPYPLGAGDCYALNEEILRREAPHFFVDSLQALESVSGELGNEDVLAMIGCSDSAARKVLLLESWLKAGGQLHIVTKESRPFQSLIEKGFFSELNRVFSQLNQKYDQEYSQYQEAYFKYKNLPLHEQQKHRLPQEPKRSVCFWTNRQVSAIDKLSDRDEAYLTLESTQIENVSNTDLKTLSVHKVLNGKKTRLCPPGVENLNIYQVRGEVLWEEVGYWPLGYWTNGQADNVYEYLKRMESEALCYFSPLS